MIKAKNQYTITSYTYDKNNNMIKKVDRNGAVINYTYFEFFAQEADARNPDGYIDNSFDNRIGYYIGIDKYKNLYVTGIKRSNRLIDLWADHLFSQTRIISEITEDDIHIIP